jgi:hypothetical protein
MFPTLEEAESYRDEHAEFTDHKADGISKEEMWRASCSWCGHSETFPDESSAEEWQESHRSQSDSHPREVEVTTSKTQRDRIKSIKSLVNRLESEHEDGAPLPLVHVLMENHGWLKSDVNDELEKLRRKGEVYEPRQGYLRCT